MMLGIVIAVVGVAVAALGIDQADKRTGIPSLVCSLLAPTGVIIALVGALIAGVPDFFEELPTVPVEEMR